MTTINVSAQNWPKANLVRCRCGAVLNSAVLNSAVLNSTDALARRERRTAAAGGWSAAGAGALQLAGIIPAERDQAATGIPA